MHGSFNFTMHVWRECSSFSGEKCLMTVRNTAFAAPMVSSVIIVLRKVAPRLVMMFPMMVKTCWVLRSESDEK